MKTLAALAVTAATVSSTLVFAAPDRPTGTIAVPIGSQFVEVWPYTTSDFEQPSDPVNLVFPGSDPREIRQALPGARREPDAVLPAQAPFNCTWTDAMGYEQAAWAETEGWVGAEIQLACVAAGAPLGNPFRFHIRLFRQGEDTLGNAHFEFLIPGTAEHEVLSWDLARAFVTLDAARTGTLTAPPGGLPMIPAGTFRAVRRPVYDALVAGGAIPILAAAGLYPTSAPAGVDVPIPTSGAAAVLAASITAGPVRLEGGDGDRRDLRHRRSPALLRRPGEPGRPRPPPGPRALRPSRRDDGLRQVRARVHPRGSPHRHSHGPAPGRRLRSGGRPGEGVRPRGPHGEARGSKRAGERERGPGAARAPPAGPRLALRRRVPGRLPPARELRLE